MDDVTKRTKEVKKPVNKGGKSDKGEKTGRPQHKDTRSDKDHRTVKNRTEKESRPERHVRSEKESRPERDVRLENRPERETKVQKDKAEVESEKKVPEKEEREENREKEKEKNKVKVVNDLASYLSMRDDGLVVVDFNTSWCGPCRGFAPVFEEIASNYPGVIFLSVDAESFDHEDTASVKSVPTFKIFLNGVMRREFSGINREKLERYIERYQIQIIVNGRTQRTFPREIKDKVLRYMNMLQPE